VGQSKKKPNGAGDRDFMLANTIQRAVVPEYRAVALINRRLD